MFFWICLIVGWGITVYLVVKFLRGCQGCTGNCKQGRLPCDCEKKNEKIN
jgi:hypothetical protein